MSRRLRIPVLMVVLAVCTFPSISQVVVDATAPHPTLRKPPSSGTAGSIGRSLPLELRVEIRPNAQNEAGKVEADFLLTNTRKTPILLPISTNPRDVEPPDPRGFYTMQVLTLRLSSSKGLGTKVRGGATLFGNEKSPKTMLALKPNQSLRIRSLVAASGLTEDSTAVLSGSADLEQVTIRITNGKALSESQDLGHAESSPFRY